MCIPMDPVPVKGLCVAGENFLIYQMQMRFALSVIICHNPCLFLSVFSYKRLFVQSLRHYTAPSLRCAEACFFVPLILHENSRFPD